MKTLLKIITATAAVALSPFVTSCSTTYDAQGRPVQSVDPGAAAAGAVAAGVVGYAIGQNNDNDRNYGYGYRRPHYSHGHRGYRY